MNAKLKITANFFSIGIRAITNHALNFEAGINSDAISHIIKHQKRSLKDLILIKRLFLNEYRFLITKMCGGSGQ